MTTPLSIRIADPADPAITSQVGQILADAFVDPVTCWLVPDDEERRRRMPGMFGLFAEQALAAGTVYIAGETGDDPAVGGPAAALWFDLVEPHPAEPDEPDPRFDAVLGPYADRWQILAETMDRHHPTDLKHHYLMLIGVVPSAQGRGIGSALLEAHHARVDELGVASYLDASSPRSRELYLRHGYIDHRPAYYVGDDGPPMFPMLRPAGGR